MLLFAGECNSYSSAGFIEGEADAKGDGRCFLEEVAWGWVFLRFDIWMDSPKGKGMLEPLTDLVGQYKIYVAIRFSAASGTNLWMTKWRHGIVTVR